MDCETSPAIATRRPGRGLRQLVLPVPVGSRRVRGGW